MNEADPNATIPPEWVNLADAGRWVERRLGIPADLAGNELKLAVRARPSPLPHRISGIALTHDRHTPLLPGGLAWQRGDGVLLPNRIVAANWEAADTKIESGTVGGWLQQDGSRERYPIQVPWQVVESFSRNREKEWRRRAAAVLQPPPYIRRPAGAPTNMPLFIEELNRRKARGEVLPIQRDEARALIKQVKNDNPTAKLPVLKTLTTNKKLKLKAACDAAKSRADRLPE